MHPVYIFDELYNGIKKIHIIPVFLTFHNWLKFYSERKEEKEKKELGIF